MNTDILFYLEIAALSALLLVQLYSFFKTKVRIDEMGTLIENSDNLVVSRLSVPVDHLRDLSPAEILANRAQYSGVGAETSTEISEKSSPDSEDSWGTGQWGGQNSDSGNGESGTTDEDDEYEDEEDFSDEEESDDDQDEDENGDWDSEDGVSEDDDRRSEAQHRTREKRTTITIIEGPDTVSPAFGKILDTINTYIIANKTGTADFGLIKEVTERNADAIEEEVNLTVSIPLFLGLMGTMFGIILGVWSMANLLPSPSDAGQAIVGIVESAANAADSDAANNASGLKTLLKNVGIAMSVSLIGLLLTTLNSGWFLKKQKIVMDGRKNDFYTFMQTSLLPVIDQGMGSTLQSLQTNLAKFNHEFSGNLQDLNLLFGDIGAVLKNQRDVMEKLENMDVNNIATYNVKVLSELTQSLDALNSFKQHLEIVVTGVERSEQLLDRFDAMLNRTSDVTDIAARLEATVSEGKALMEFLTKHKDSLEKFEQSTSGAISETGLNISDMFKKLEEHIGESIQQISNFTADEAVILRDAVSEGRLNLGNLSFLENINDVLRTIRDNADKTNANLSPQLEKMSKSMDNLNRVLGNLEKKVASMQQGGGGIRKLFGGGPRSGDGA